MSTTQKTATGFKWWYILIFAVVGLLWYLTYWLVPKFYCPPDGAGTFGDMFGAVNALFSGLAFATLIITIDQQRQQLIAQERELHQNTEALNNQKKELEKQWREMEQQNETLKLQRFESLFGTILTTIPENVPEKFALFVRTYINTVDMNNSSSVQELELLWFKGEKASPDAKAREWLNNFIHNFETVVAFVSELSVQYAYQRRYYKLYFSSFDTFARTFLFYHITLRSTRLPKGIKNFRRLLFEPVRDSNELYSPHFEILYDGIQTKREAEKAARKSKKPE
jgi:hypothetical protein